MWLYLAGGGVNCNQPSFSRSPVPDSQREGRQGSYSLEKALNFGGCLKKALNCMGGPEKPLDFI